MKRFLLITVAVLLTASAFAVGCSKAPETAAPAASAPAAPAPEAVPPAGQPEQPNQ